MANTIKVEILGEVQGIRKSLQTVEGQLGGFGKSMGKVGGLMKGAFVAAGAAVAGSKIKDFFSDSIQAASDLEQSTGAIEAVFGKQADGMKKNAEGAAQAFGLSKNSYQELATVLGAGLKNQGIKDFGGETQKVIGLGADLAAQFGGSTKEAVESIASLMRGEADPIEKYGVSIKETAINAELAARGQSKLKGAALEQAKAQARLSLLFKQTTSAQGAFAREGDTLATKQQKNAAAWENLKAKLGTVFLPVMVKVQEFLANKVLPVVEQVFGWIADNAPAAITAVKGFLGGLKGDGAASKYLDYVKTAFSAILPIIQGIVTAFVAAWPQINSALSSTMGALTSLMGAVKLLWGLFGPTIIAQVTNVFKTIFTVISGVMQVIAGVIRVFSAIIQGDWRGAWEGVKQIFAGVWTVIKGILVGVLNVMNSTLGGALTRVKQTWTAAWNAVKAFLSTAWNAMIATIASKVSSALAKIKSAVNSIKAVWSAGWNALKSALSNAWNSMISTLASKVSSVKNKIQEIKSKITSVFSNAGSWLRDAGRRIMDGLIGGIERGIDRVRSLLNRVTDMIPDWKGPKERDSKLLYDAGRLIMNSLVDGLADGETPVARQLRSLTTFIGESLDGVMSPTLSPSVSFAGIDASLASASGVGAAGAPIHYTIEVSVPVGADKVATGREIVAAIREYENAGGRK